MYHSICQHLLYHLTSPLKVGMYALFIIKYKFSLQKKERKKVSMISYGITSYLAVDAVLEQFVDGVWQTLAFFSKNLQLLERNYSAFD